MFDIILIAFASFFLACTIRTTAHAYWPILLLYKPVNCDVCMSFWGSVIQLAIMYMVDCIDVKHAIGIVFPASFGAWTIHQLYNYSKGE